MAERDSESLKKQKTLLLEQMATSNKAAQDFQVKYQLAKESGKVNKDRLRSVEGQILSLQQKYEALYTYCLD